MSKVGDSCQVEFPRAGTYPYFCQVHAALGMKGVITVGNSAGGATTTTQGGGEVGGSVVEPPSAAAPPSSGRPAIYWAGWGLFADRKSTRLNSSHANISYAVFCLKKKNK